MIKILKICAGALLFSAGAVMFAEGPQWWVERGVASPSAASDTSSVNFSTVNQGQLLNIAKQAAAELDEKFEEGCGTAIAAFISEYSSYSSENAAASADDLQSNFRAVNIGQLKAVSKLFYDRLWELKGTHPDRVAWPQGMVFQSEGKYPWPTLSGEANLALANIGQLKHLFAWSISE